MTNRKEWNTGLSSGCFGGLTESLMEGYAKAGIKSLEFSGGNDVGYENWKNIPLWSKNTGVDAWSTHLPSYCCLADSNPERLKGSLNRLCEILSLAGDSGFKVAVVHGSFDGFYNGGREEMLECCANSLGVLCAHAKEVGMQIAIESLPRTCLGNCVEEIQYLLDRNPDLRVCFDTNHLMKDTNTNFIRSIGSKIVTTHISDYDFIDERHQFPGDGLVDWKELQEEMEKIDYTGPFVYEISRSEDREGRNTLEDIRANHLWMMNL